MKHHVFETVRPLGLLYVLQVQELGNWFSCEKLKHGCIIPELVLLKTELLDDSPIGAQTIVRSWFVDSLDWVLNIIIFNIALKETYADCYPLQVIF